MSDEQQFDPAQLTFCANPDCGDPSENLKQCTGCRTVAYCSPACQRIHWPIHKTQCKLAAAARREAEEKRRQQEEAAALAAENDDGNNNHNNDEPERDAQAEAEAERLRQQQQLYEQREVAAQLTAASRSIESLPSAGSVPSSPVVEQQPASNSNKSALDAKLAEQGCSGCGSTTKELHACSACKSVAYCSRECQRADWPAHKHLCKALAAERQAKLVEEQEAAAAAAARQEEQEQQEEAAQPVVATEEEQVTVQEEVVEEEQQTTADVVAAGEDRSVSPLSDEGDNNNEENNNNNIEEENEAVGDPNTTNQVEPEQETIVEEVQPQAEPEEQQQQQQQPEEAQHDVEPEAEQQQQQQYDYNEEEQGQQEQQQEEGQILEARPVDPSIAPLIDENNNNNNNNIVEADVEQQQEQHHQDYSSSYQQNQYQNPHPDTPTFGEYNDEQQQQQQREQQEQEETVVETQYEQQQQQQQQQQQYNFNTEEHQVGVTEDGQEAIMGRDRGDVEIDFAVAENNNNSNQNENYYQQQQQEEENINNYSNDQNYENDNEEKIVVPADEDDEEEQQHAVATTTTTSVAASVGFEKKILSNLNSIKQDLISQVSSKLDDITSFLTAQQEERQKNEETEAQKEAASTVLTNVAGGLAAVLQYQRHSTSELELHMREIKKAEEFSIEYRNRMEELLRENESLRNEVTRLRCRLFPEDNQQQEQQSEVKKVRFFAELGSVKFMLPGTLNQYVGVLKKAALERAVRQGFIPIPSDTVKEQDWDGWYLSFQDGTVLFDDDVLEDVGAEAGEVFKIYKQGGGVVVTEQIAPKMVAPPAPAPVVEQQPAAPSSPKKEQQQQQPAAVSRRQQQAQLQQQTAEQNQNPNLQQFVSPQQLAEQQRREEEAKQRASAESDLQTKLQLGAMILDAEYAERITSNESIERRLSIEMRRMELEAFEAEERAARKSIRLRRIQNVRARLMDKCTYGTSETDRKAAREAYAKLNSVVEGMNSGTISAKEVEMALLNSEVVLAREPVAPTAEENERVAELLRAEELSVKEKSKLVVDIKDMCDIIKFKLQIVPEKWKESEDLIRRATTIASMMPIPATLTLSGILDELGAFIRNNSRPIR